MLTSRLQYQPSPNWTYVPKPLAWDATGISVPHSCVRLLILSATQVPRTCKYDAAVFLLVTMFHRKVHHLKRWEIQVLGNPVPMASIFCDISWKVRERQRKKYTLGGKKRQSVDISWKKRTGQESIHFCFLTHIENISRSSERQWQ